MKIPDFNLFEWICVGVFAAFVIGYVWKKIVKSIKPKDEV